MKVAIIGEGFKKGALLDFLYRKEGVKLTVMTAQFDYGEVIDDPQDAVFISVQVPTYLCEEKNIYKQNDNDLIAALLAIRGNPVVFICSTVMPGTCERLRKDFKLRIYHMPLFLTEKNALDEIKTFTPVVDCMELKKPENEDSFYKTDVELMDILKKLFGYIVVSSPSETEYAKYVIQAFAAIKINFFNNVNQYCEENNINFESVLSIVTSHGKVDPKYTQVPGPDGLYGYGKTLTKDIKIFHQIMSSYTQVPILTDIENGVFRNKKSD